jgi:hypothetical protein
MRGNKAEYEVGYGKPPMANRFKKGQSGNPNGRSKKPAADFQPGNILQSVDNEEINVNLDGKKRRMPKAEIHFRQLFNKSIRGDLDAARILARMAEKYFGPEAKGPGETRFVVARKCPSSSNKNA